MSVELYHFEPNANGGKPIIALKEKGVTFTSHWVDLLNGQQYEPEYLAVNPKGQVPTLVHDGTVIWESTPMGEYIDEAFEGPSLRPEDPVERARMRNWSRFGDEFLGPSLSMIGWSSFIAPMMKQKDPAELEAFQRKIPTAERREAWRKTIESDFSEEELAESRRRLAVSAERLEEQLSRTEWLAGSSYSLADINLFNMAAGLPMMVPHVANAERAPHLLRWIERIRARPAVAAAMALSRNAFQRGR
ncbi:MAG TPA: glutathione S-transferase family protein [Alteraurantiacibacter sp.]